MRSSAEGDLVLAKLEDGEDLLASVEALAAEHGIQNGLVLWGIGMLRDVELGFFNGKAYERTAFAEGLELVALHGSFAAKADPKLHLHAALAGADKRLVGGHVFRGTVNVLNELCLWRLRKTTLDRVLNPRSGLKELRIGPP